MEPIIIRKALAADRADLKVLLDRSWHQHWAPHVLPTSVERFVRERPADGYVDAAWSAFVVAERREEVVGMYHLEDGSLHAIHVTPEVIGSGVGKALMQHAETAGAVRLEVRIFNGKALQFYLYRGWRQTGEVEAFEMGTPTPSIIMARPA